MTKLDTSPSHCYLSLSLCPDWVAVLYLSPSPSLENLCHPTLKSFFGTSPNWRGLSWIFTSFVSPSLRGFGGLVTQSCLTVCNPMGCSPTGSSVHGILQARILEWIAIPFSWVSSWPRDWTQVSHIAGRFLTIWATQQPLIGFNPLYSHLRLWYISLHLKPLESVCVLGLGLSHLIHCFFFFLVLIPTCESRDALIFIWGKGLERDWVSPLDPSVS